MSQLAPVVLFSLMAGGMVVVLRKLRRDPAAYDAYDVKDMRSVAPIRLADLVALAQPDLVRVAGQAVAPERAVTSPLSGRSCVACVVELYRDGNPEPFATFPDVAPFFVEEGGVRVRVEPPCPVLALAGRVTGEGAGDQLPAAFQAEVDERWDYDDWRHAHRLRWIERRVEVGERVAVVGRARRQLDGGGGFEGYREAPSLVVIENDEGAPLSLSDHPSVLGEPAKR
jgi:hypothetical protein